MQKLPAILAVKHALLAVIHFRKAGIRIGLPWILALTGANILELMFFGNGGGAGDVSTQSMKIPPSYLIIAAFSLIIFSSIAVNWHRYILLDEVTAPEKILRLDGPVWTYAGRTLLIMLLALAPVVALSTIVFGSYPGLTLLLMLPFFVAGVYIMRMSVALPAIALERKGFGIGAALQVTQGNNLQFAGLLALNALILMATFLVLGLILSIVGSASPATARVLAIALSVPANLFLSLFSVSLLSSLYGFFAENRKF